MKPIDGKGEPTLSLNTLRDAIYQDAVAHGLWDDMDDLIGASFVSRGNRAWWEVFGQAERGVDVCADDGD